MMTDSIRAMLEWIVEDALPARPRRVWLRVSPALLQAEHDGRECVRSAAALALVVARRGARVARAPHAWGGGALEVRADGSSREVTLRADPSTAHTCIEWARAPPSPDEGPSAAEVARAHPNAAAHHPLPPPHQLRLCDVRAFLQFLPAGVVEPVTLHVSVLASQSPSVRHLQIDYEPPLCDLRETTAQWLGLASAAEIGAVHSTCEAAGVCVVVTAALSNGAAADESALVLLPFLDSLPLAPAKQHACARELSAVDWSRYGVALAEPAAPFDLAAPRSAARARGTCLPAGTAAGRFAAAGADDDLDTTSAHGMPAALRLPLVFDVAPSSRSARALERVSAACAARDGAAADAAFREGASSTGADGGGPPGDGGVSGGIRQPPTQLDLFIGIHIFTLVSTLRGTSTVAHWDELHAEQRGPPVTAAVCAAIDDLRKRSPRAERALRSKAARDAALVREAFAPRMAGAIVRLLETRTGSERVLRELAPPSGSAAEASEAVTSQLCARYDAQLGRGARAAAKAARGQGGARRGRRTTALVEPELDEDDKDSDDQGGWHVSPSHAADDDDDTCTAAASGYHDAGRPRVARGRDDGGIGATAGGGGRWAERVACSGHLEQAAAAAVDDDDDDFF
ncbi:hypothetical protein KFE25_012333 [Diacronema lutheri]|uniref:Uncharacterized protein n=1 Tax=Diacronema lutheri TaxID=2081491 RepID=A0A8J5XLD6_DIALT|nr:hypothetical protein KFE25_012333 [Diacronema lutheri]